MHNAIALLSELSQSDTDWIFENGVIQTVNADHVIIEQGKHPDAIYFVLEGVVGIYVRSTVNRKLAVLGPGELIGEMSFLEDLHVGDSSHKVAHRIDSPHQKQQTPNWPVLNWHP